jgi:hemerythrin-like domain-containing protein
MEDNMKATEILMEEHRMIEKVINAIERQVNRVENGDKANATFFINASDFIKGFADGCHHRKEENALFSAMVLAGIPKENGPIGQMLIEHEQGRQYNKGIRSAAEELLKGNEGNVDELLENSKGYTQLLHQHINKENNILFPMANKAIPIKQQEELEKEFERIENEETGQGIHRMYEELAEMLISIT